MKCDYCGKKKRWWQSWWCLGGKTGYYDFCTEAHERFFKVDTFQKGIKW